MTAARRRESPRWWQSNAWRWFLLCWWWAWGFITAWMIAGRVYG